MEAYRIYLQAYEAASRGDTTTTVGSSIPVCAAVALACYDAKKGNPPRRSDEAVREITSMSKDAPCA